MIGRGWGTEGSVQSHYWTGGGGENTCVQASGHEDGGRLLSGSCLPAELARTNIKPLLPLARANATDVSEKLDRKV